MKTTEIILMIFASLIALVSLIVIIRGLRKQKYERLGMFDEIMPLPNGENKIKFSSTTFFSFLFLLFLFMGNLIFIGVIADNIGDITWQFNTTFFLFNILFILAVVAPKQLKNINYNELINTMKK